MPIGTAPRFWIWGCHRFEKLPYGCRDMAISMCLAPNMFLRHRESVVETEQMSSVETRQMSQQQSSVLSQQQTSVLSQQKTSILSQQKTSVLAQCCPRLLLAAAGCHGPKSCQKALSFCVPEGVFELATPYSVREGRRSVSSSIDFYNNFLHSSSANTPPLTSIGLLKIRQNPSVQALFGECQRK